MKKIFLLLLLFFSVVVKAQVPEFWGLAGSSCGVGDRLVTTIFKIKGDGTGFTTIDTIDHCPQFTGNLFQASNGKLYGIKPRGIVFCVDPVSNIYQELDTIGCYANVLCGCFPPWCTTGNYPNPNFIEGKQGLLYGSLYDRIFSFNLNDNTATVFPSVIPNNEGINCFIIATNGKIYLTANNISNGNTGGSLYSFDTITHVFDSLTHWNYQFASIPTSILQGSDGLLYGIISQPSEGKIFSYDITNNTSRILINFDSFLSNYSYNPQGLTQGTNGKLYGTCQDNVIYSLDTTHGNPFSVLHDFGWSQLQDSMGTGPTGGLILASDCKIYGMTAWGGKDSTGVIFSFDPANNNYTKIFDASLQTIRPYFIGGLTELNPTACTNTSIASLQGDNHYSIFPNPANEYIAISSGENLIGTTAVFTDITGRKVSEIKLEAQTTSLETFNWANGIYFVTITRYGTKKIILNK